MLLRIVLTFLMLAAASTPVFAASAQPPEAVVGAADQRMQAQRYDEAVTLYRRYLRRAPRDYKAWSKLGAAYFYTGQPRKALKNLKHAERRTPEKAYNYYFQGLCYELLGQTEKAKGYLQYAGQKLKDEWAARAAFEMGVIEYKARDKDKATYWLQQALEKRPKGPLALEAQRLLQSLKEERWLDDPQGAPLPDTEKALFKYNNFSFSQKPHYWFLSGGGRYVLHEGKAPDQNGKLKNATSDDQAAIFDTGAGVGPLRYGNATVTAGYTYKQLWNTNDARLAEWLDDWTDFVYFPLRADLLERRHLFSVDMRQDLGGSYYYGVYARYEMIRLGSSFFPSPEIEELQQSITLADTQLLIPWVGFTFNNTMRSLAYLYLRKEINDNQPAYSNQTFTFGGGEDGRPTVSLGLSHSIDLPAYEASFDLEAFHYEFVYNDKFLDYLRNGFFLSAENRLLLNLTAALLFGYYSDDYVRPRIKSTSCSEKPSTLPGAAPTTPGTPRECFRTDTGTMVQATGSWTFSPMTRLDGSFQVVTNDNASLKEYQDTKTTFQVTFTTAFPSVRRVSRIVDRYADTAFTKEQP